MLRLDPGHGQSLAETECRHQEQAGQHTRLDISEVLTVTTRHLVTFTVKEFLSRLTVALPVNPELASVGPWPGWVSPVHFIVTRYIDQNWIWQDLRYFL